MNRQQNKSFHPTRASLPLTNVVWFLCCYWYCGAGGEFQRYALQVTTVFDWALFLKPAKL
jgi:hypothetical protein